MWLYGVIGRTEDWDQPVYRYTLDNQRVSTVVAEPKNETSYNELLAHLYGLDPSYHTLLVENINEGAVLFIDYYLVEPVPPTEAAISKVALPTGGETLTTSISERPMIVMTTNVSLSGNALIGLILGVVVGVLGIVLIAIAAFLFCRRRRNAKPYYYQSTTVSDVLSDGARKPPVITATHPDPLPQNSYLTSTNPNGILSPRLLKRLLDPLTPPLYTL